jgi:hypothetical protein
MSNTTLPPEKVKKTPQDFIVEVAEEMGFENPFIGNVVRPKIAIEAAVRYAA